MVAIAMAGRGSPALRLRKRVRVSIAKRARSLREPHRLVMRARIIMLAVEGVPNAEIGRRLQLSESCVRKWRRRIEARPQVTTLRDAPRSGRPPEIPVTVRCELVKLACQRPADRPKAPLGQVWTRPMLQQALLQDTGVLLSLSEITRTLRCGGLRPHRVRMWLHSPDPEFRQKAKRVCALSLSPPPGSTVVCVDEKPGMQALERLHPLHVVGGVARQEFEYKRHGTSTLIAAFDILTGEVFGRLRRRTAAGLMRFMEELAKKYPRGPVYVIWDNLNTHHDGPTLRWTKFNERHGHRFHFVHTPKHASWVNQVEVWFSILARRVLKNASFASKRELNAEVRRFITYWNRRAHPFRWTFRGDFAPRQLRWAA
jgi:transposase